MLPCERYKRAFDYLFHFLISVSRGGKNEVIDFLTELYKKNNALKPRFKRVVLNCVRPKQCIPVYFTAHVLIKDQTGKLGHKILCFEAKRR